MARRIGGSVMLAGLAIAPALGQTAGMLSYQGLLKENGTPVSGLVTLQFRIYDAPTGGNLVDMDGDGVIENVVGQDVKQVANVNVTDGLFTATWGPVSPIAFTGSSRWLQITVNGTHLSRTEMATAPATAEQINRPGTGTPAIQADGLGRIGIGTATPQARLHVWHSLGQSSIRSERIVNDNAGPIIALVHGRGSGIPIQQFDGAGEVHFTLIRANGSEVLASRIYSTLAISPAESGSMSFQVRGADGSLKTPLALHETGASVTVLTITGGSDLAEPFPVCKDNLDLKPQPGHLVAINPGRPGGLWLAAQPYDKRVAGIISGANGLAPGMVMKAEGHEHVDGDHPVALAGRVWCWADAGFGAIEPGDRLTTSATPGHAMKVTDEGRAPGAVVGKAMTPLASGKGLVLVLVQPQ